MQNTSNARLFRSGTLNEYFSSPGERAAGESSNLLDEQLGLRSPSDFTVSARHCCLWPPALRSLNPLPWIQCLKISPRAMEYCRHEESCGLCPPHQDGYSHKPRGIQHSLSNSQRLLIYSNSLPAIFCPNRYLWSCVLQVLLQTGWPIK